MSIIKRITCFLIPLIMLISTFSVTKAEQTAAESYPEEIKLLKSIGIINETDNYLENMTRGEFAQIICNLIGKNQLQAETQRFSDVDVENEYFGAISFVDNRGVMSGYGDGAFKPNGYISFSEAAAVFVNILGYGAKAEVKGGYPTGHILIAGEISLLKGLKYGNTDYINKEQVYKLTYNSLFIAIAQQTSFGDMVNYDSSEGNTILNLFLDIDYTKGIIEDNSITSLKGKSNITENAILINDLIIETNSSDILDMLGCYVEVFYRIDDDINTLVHISETENKHTVLTIKADEIIKASLTQIKYIENDKTNKTVKIKTDADYIYNGEAVSTLLPKQLEISNGAIKLIDFDNDNIFDVLFVEEFQTMVYISGNMEGDMLFGKYGDKANLEDFEKVRFLKNGAEILRKDLKPYDILAISKGKAYAVIEVCTTAVFGVLNEVSDRYYKVNDKEYKLAKEYKESNLTLPKVGKEGTFYLGKEDVLAYFEEAATQKIGIATHLTKNTSSIGYTNPEIKIFTTENEFIIYEFEEKIQLNGVYVKEEDIYKETEIFNDGNFIRQVVQYEIGEQGKIKSIEFADMTKPDDDKLQYASDVRSYRWCNPGTDAISPTADIENQDNRAFFVVAKTLYFKVPEDINAERFYSAFKGPLPYQHDTTINNTQVFFNTYSDKRSAVASIIVSEVKTSRIGDWATRSSVVEKVSREIGPDGVECDTLHVWTLGKKEKYYAADSTKINGLITGDIIQLTEKENVIERYRKSYSAKYNKSSIEFYLDLKNKNKLENLKDFYHIEDINSVDTLEYYINKEIIESERTYSSRSNNSWNTDKGGVYITGKVVFKDGRYMSVVTDEGKELQFLLNENEYIYYKTCAYRFMKSANKISFISSDNICVDDTVYVFTEAYSVVDVMVID